MPTKQNRIQEERFYRVMRLLQEAPELSQREIAHKLDMSLGGLNYCLNALIDKGFVKLDNFHHSKHKLKYVYILTPAGIAQKMAIAGRFLKRKLEEYEALKADIEALRSLLGEDVI
jgi:EPS-associated MarR family transcriptional regulator